MTDVSPELEIHYKHKLQVTTVLHFICIYRIQKETNNYCVDKKKYCTSKRGATQKSPKLECHAKNE
jgi:hypothetical protein